MQRKKTPTIHDVAREAGVSVSTVSRVLNNKVDVSKDTFDRVQQIIEDLEYSSSLAARSMRSRVTNVIGVIIPDVGDPYAFMVIQGVNQATVELDYDLMIFTSSDFQKRTSPTKEQQYISLLNSGITDGVIMVAPTSGNFVSPAPVVSIEPNIIDTTGPTVLSTNYQGAFEATKYLIDLGHTRIGFISGRMDLQSAIRRKQGYQDALEQSGLSLDETLVEQGDFTKPTARDCARTLLSLTQRPTAIFAANDRSAIGVLEVAAEMNLDVPNDLSVMGFDNLVESAIHNLTTVDQHIHEMGYRAGHLLVNMITNQADKTLVKVGTDMIIRNTTKALEKTF